MLIEKDLTRTIKGCFYDVQNQVGLGLPEEAYQKGLKEAFRLRGIPTQPKYGVVLKFRDQDVVTFRPDFIVADKVVLELKTVREDFARERYIQLYSYLKATGIRLGFLVNFGRERVKDQRVVFDAKPMVIDEDWTTIANRIDGEEKEIMTRVRRAIHEIGEQHGLGYGEETYRKLVEAAISHTVPPVNSEPKTEPFYNERSVGIHPIDCFVVDSKIVCVIAALKDGLNQFDISRVRSYLTNLRLRFGVAANFGKNSLEIKGVIVN